MQFLAAPPSSCSQRRHVSVIAVIFFKTDINLFPRSAQTSFQNQFLKEKGMPLKLPGIYWWMASFLPFPPLLLTDPVQTTGPWLCLAPLWWNTLPLICVSRAGSVWAHFRAQRYGSWWWTWVQCLDFKLLFITLDEHMNLFLLWATQTHYK